MISNISLKDMGKLIQQKGSIIILPHVNPDGDAMGSSIALCLAMRKMGKEAWVLLEDEVPQYINFMDVSCCTKDKDIIKDPDICICLDCSEENRFPGRRDVYRRGRTKLCIDHHVAKEGFGDHYYIDESEAATAQLVYKLFDSAGWEIDRAVANHLYVGIITDTGCFQYSNTSADTHMIAAELFRKGVSHMDIMIRLYQNVSKKKIDIEKAALDKMQMFADGKIAMTYVSKEMLKSTDATLDDTEGIIDMIRNIEGVELAGFLKEKNDCVKVSLRAKADGNVDKIAAKFGGGGHVKAAGCTMKMPIEEAFSRLKEEMIASMEQYDKK